MPRSSAWAQGDTPNEDDESGILAYWMLGIPKWSSNLFAWHPVLMTVYFVSQAFAIACWSVITFSHHVAKIFHVLFQFAAVSSMISGLVAVVSVMNPTGTKWSDNVNVVTMHQFVGVSSVVVFGLNFFLGSYMAYKKAMGLPTIVKENSPKPVTLVVHQMVGLGSVAFTGAAILTGIQQQLAGQGVRVKMVMQSVQLV